ncbi:hypothetical protein [Piscinibacter koreensis]|uniref:Uncharacterized protein n=1 Tax=Piscinibacter koreensis TaxID=2742824 RepID=A0A7Y6NTR0_9BURK|nr:hypothetical protein [Schlegelella koreensis]NUZ09119.1 hypothetical protein [Schlegelella koreensis]
MGKTDQSDLLTTEDLEEAFRSKYPSATDQQIAALMAAFLEEVPGQAVLDDGGFTGADAIGEGWPDALAAWIRELKEFAGDAYPPR